MKKNSPLKIVIILPEARINKLKIPPFIDISFREAPLTASWLAALVPGELETEIRIVDESVGQKVPFDKGYDIAAISVMTGTANRAYEIAREFKKRETTVVLGGVHVTLLPDEAKKWAHVIVTGSGGTSWPALIRDYVKGKLKSHYDDTAPDVNKVTLPRRDLQKSFGYMIPNTVMVTRGCKNSCAFCSVPAANYGFQKRDIGEAIAEIKGLKSSRFAISDVHLTNDTEYAKEFLTALIPLKKKWGALASTAIADDDRLLDLLQKSGCTYLLIGFESINQSALTSIDKGFNQSAYYKKVVQKLHDRNIMIQGCFIFGFDEDDTSVFEQTVDFINEIQIDIPRYAVYTPYPKTALFDKLEQEQRLLHKNWHYYDTQHVVFKPKKMSPAELDRGFKWAWNKTFKVSSSLKRSFRGQKDAYVTFIGNLAYKLYLHRLNRNKNRFPEEVSHLVHER